jgi:hypothetical protein
MVRARGSGALRARLFQRSQAPKRLARKVPSSATRALSFARKALHACAPSKTGERPSFLLGCLSKKPCKPPLWGCKRAQCAHAPPVARHERRGKGLSRPLAGRLEGAEKRSGEVGARQRASSSDWPQLFERSGRRPRSEFCGPTLPRASQGSPAEGGTTRMKPGRRSAQPQRRVATPKRSTRPATLSLNPRPARATADPEASG